MSKSDVSEVFGVVRQGPLCWYVRLLPYAPQEAQDYLSEVEAVMAETGREPTWTALAEKLTSLGFDMSDDRLRHHYRRRAGKHCRCPR